MVKISALDLSHGLSVFDRDPQTEVLKERVFITRILFKSCVSQEAASDAVDIKFLLVFHRNFDIFTLLPYIELVLNKCLHAFGFIPFIQIAGILLIDAANFTVNAVIPGIPLSVPYITKGVLFFFPVQFRQALLEDLKIRSMERVSWRQSI